MNKEFEKHALTHGQEGKDWLKRIPGIIKEAEVKWAIQVLPPFNLNYNYVAPATCTDGTKAVLKIGFPTDREFQTEIEALRVFEGEGINKIYEIDKQNATILIERVTPGAPLSNLEDDEKATRILAHVMKKLRKPVPPDNTFITIREWTKELTEYMNKHNHSGPLPWHLIEKAHTLFETLIKTSQPSVLVHGDLHHDNVLSSDRDEWLAIDPKGVAAEPAYETAAMIRNPYKKMDGNPNLKKILRRRIVVLAEELNFDPNRIQQWSFAQTMLSAVWSDAGSTGAQHAVRIAEALDTIIF